MLLVLDRLFRAMQNPCGADELSAGEVTSPRAAVRAHP